MMFVVELAVKFVAVTFVVVVAIVFGIVVGVVIVVVVAWLWSRLSGGCSLTYGHVTFVI